MTQEPGSGSPMSERMQSLLSRAVEDQLSEQRQLAGALNEVRAGLSRLGDQLDGVTDRLARIEEVVARAVEGSEVRLTEHVDEAVLALAEALLRRRPSRPTVPGESEQPHELDEPEPDEMDQPAPPGH